MDHNLKHYKKDKSHFFKNVVYKNRLNGEIIIAVVTGDLEVNQTKLEQAIKAVGQLESATNEDLVALGTKTGFVHSWGHKGARYIGDLVLQDARNLIGGQKRATTDSINVNYGRDFTCEKLADIALAQPGNMAEDGGELLEKRGIEVGNIFQLGYHYTNLMKGATFMDSDGKPKPYYMGFYGIGIGRTLASIVEKFNDEKGIIWPESVAPFKIHLISIKGAEEQAENIYQDLLQKGIEVLYDDREVSPGIKFADSDLMGIPYRIVVSPKTLDKNSVEVKKRNEKDFKLVDLDKIVE
jgi:prolyl-tRNA synthetase